MTKRPGCLRAYILYIVLFFVYFLVIGMICKLAFPHTQSDTTWILLPTAAILSMIAVLLFNNRVAIRKSLHI